jgi:T5orf172 domain-containing protein
MSTTYQYSVIYILSNPYFADLVKIGWTSSLANVQKRMDALYTTAVPARFFCEYKAEILNASKVESILHKTYKDYRVNPKREFFHLDPNDVIELVEQFEKPNTKHISTQKTQENKKMDDYKAGTILTFARDSNIKIEVVEQDIVLFKSKLIALRDLTCKLANEENIQDLWLDEQVSKIQSLENNGG